MATKSKKTTRSTTRAKSTAKTAKTATKATASKTAATSSAVEAAVKKVAASPSTSPSTSATKTEAAPAKTGISGVTRPVTQEAGEQVGKQAVNKKELVGRVAKRADLRPNQVRAVTEAVLAELGQALANGEELKLPGLGKLQVKRKKDQGEAEVMICKIRRKKDENSDTAPLAPAAE